MKISTKQIPILIGLVVSLSSCRPTDSQGRDQSGGNGSLGPGAASVSGVMSDSNGSGGTVEIYKAIVSDDPEKNQKDYELGCEQEGLKLCMKYDQDSYDDCARLEKASCMLSASKYKAK